LGKHVKTTSENGLETAGITATRWFRPSYLGLAPILAIIPFLTRMTNTYLPSFAAADIMHPFMLSILYAVCVAAVALLLASRKTDVFARPVVGVAGSLAVSLGLMFSLYALTMPALIYAGGILIGSGLTLVLGSWNSCYRLLGSQGILLHSTCSFLVMSVLWFAAAHIESSASLCYVLCLYSLVSGGALLLAKKTPASPLTPLRPATPPITTSRNLVTDTTTSHSMPRATFSFLWVSFLGVAYCFFVSGMTFIPDIAGLDDASGEALYPRPISYLVVALIIVTLFLLRRRHSTPFNVRLFYQTVLPIAAAILMVFPFIDLDYGVFVDNLAGIAGFVGFCFFYLLSWAAAAMVPSISRYPADRAFLLLALICAGSFLIGGQTILLIGSQGQAVSLVLLAAYLVATTISVIHNSKLDEVQVPAACEPPEAQSPVEQAVVVRCEQIAQRYRLSERETEILGHLSQGRSAAHIADRLCISRETVRTHVKRIYIKTGVHQHEELLNLLDGNGSEESEVVATARRCRTASKHVR
jgi:DNA-binding CsgD family transcriptional regulator